MTQKKPDAVVTDLDGSLLGPDHKVGPRDREAIRRLLELGVPVMPGTGRPPIGCRPLAKELGIRLILCANGGCSFDLAESRVLSAAFMDHGTARRLLDWLFRENYNFLIHTPWQILRSPGASHIARYELRGPEEDGLVTPDSSLEGLEILKVLIVGCDGPAVCARARRVFSPEELTICSSDSLLVDFNPPGVNKGRGLRAMARSMGWDLGNVLALGDNYNDREMLEAVGLSAAPATAVPEILSAAKYVSAPCGENPLSQAVEHYFPGLLGP